VYDGFYPGFGFGYDAYDPFWAYNYGDYGPPPAYGPAPGTYGPDQGPYGPPPQGAYGPQGQYGAPQQQASAYPQPGAYPPPAQDNGIPMDNSRGFYLWPVGIQDGRCDRAYAQQAAQSLTHMQAVALQSGTVLGGIAVAPVIHGRAVSHLDLTDQICATESLEHARTGETISWQTANGTPVTFWITRSSQDANRNCRDFEASLQIAGHSEVTKGSACKAPNGSWEAKR
jgi:surface antigen